MGTREADEDRERVRWRQRIGMIETDDRWIEENVDGRMVKRRGDGYE